MNRKQVIARFYGILKQLEKKSKTKEGIVLSWTKGRTGHLSELSDVELSELVLWCQQEMNRQFRPMRAKIVAKLCELGYTADGKPDYHRINQWCETYTAAKKPLLKQSYVELQATTNTVVNFYKKEIRKRIQ